MTWYGSTSLTPYSKVLFERLLVPWLVNKFPASYMTKGSVPCANKPIPCLYPKPEFRACPSILFLLRSVSISSAHACLDLPKSPFPSHYPIKILHAFLFYPIHATWTITPPVHVCTNELQAFNNKPRHIRRLENIITLYKLF